MSKSSNGEVVSASLDLTKIPSLKTRAGDYPDCFVRVLVVLSGLLIDYATQNHGMREFSLNKKIKIKKWMASGSSHFLADTRNLEAWRRGGSFRGAAEAMLLAWLGCSTALAAGRILSRFGFEDSGGVIFVRESHPPQPQKKAKINNTHKTHDTRL